MNSTLEQQFVSLTAAIGELVAVSKVGFKDLAAKMEDLGARMAEVKDETKALRADLRHDLRALSDDVGSMGDDVRRSLHRLRRVVETEPTVGPSLAPTRPEYAPDYQHGGMLGDRLENYPFLDEKD